MFHAWLSTAFRELHPNAPTDTAYGSTRKLLEPLPFLLLADSSSDSRMVTATLDLEALLECRTTTLSVEHSMGPQACIEHLIRAAKLVYTPQVPAPQDQLLLFTLCCGLIRRYVKAGGEGANGKHSQGGRTVRGHGVISCEWLLCCWWGSSHSALLSACLAPSTLQQALLLQLLQQRAQRVGALRCLARKLPLPCSAINSCVCINPMY